MFWSRAGKTRNIGYLHEGTRFSIGDRRTDGWVEVTQIYGDVALYRPLLARQTDVDCSAKAP